MQLFSWKSGYLKDYSRGTIIVMAETVEDARVKVRKHFDVHFTKSESEWYPGDTPTLEELLVDEENREKYNEKLAMFEEDIAKDPIIDDVLFIEGGE